MTELSYIIVVEVLNTLCKEKNGAKFNKKVATLHQTFYINFLVIFFPFQLIKKHFT